MERDRRVLLQHYTPYVQSEREREDALNHDWVSKRMVLGYLDELERRIGTGDQDYPDLYNAGELIRRRGPNSVKVRLRGHPKETPDENA